MNQPRIKTASEQRVEWLESLGRPLTDEESAMLQRAMRSVYHRDWRLEREKKALKQHEAEERELTERLSKEAAQPRWYPER